jgi:hypothetical protein
VWTSKSASKPASLLQQAQQQQAAAQQQLAHSRLRPALRVYWAAHVSTAGVRLCSQPPAGRLVLAPAVHNVLLCVQLRLAPGA